MGRQRRDLGVRIVVAGVIALNGGISPAFWTGFCSYALACGALVWATSRVPHATTAGLPASERVSVRALTA
jgi:hypothetical protein